MTITPTPAEITTALTTANRYFVERYGVSQRFNAGDALRAFGAGRGFLTLAELRSLEHAGLAVGYAIKSASGQPEATELGQAAVDFLAHLVETASTEPEGI